MKLRRLFGRLPFSPNLARTPSKIALGVSLLTFLTTYQPAFEIPPLKKAVVRAQNVQEQQISVLEVQIQFQLPHAGYLSTYFSSFHPGIDLAASLNMPIQPIAPGLVQEAGFNFFGLGNTVVINHGYGYKSTYAHLGKIYVKKNQSVDADSLIGKVGLTGHTSGPHTHLEVSKDGKNIDPLTILPPIRILPQTEDFFVYQNQTAEIKVDFRDKLKTSL